MLLRMCKGGRHNLPTPTSQPMQFKRLSDVGFEARGIMEVGGHRYDLFFNDQDGHSGDDSNLDDDSCSSF